MSSHAGPLNLKGKHSTEYNDEEEYIYIPSENEGTEDEKEESD